MDLLPPLPVSKQSTRTVEWDVSSPREEPLPPGVPLLAQAENASSPHPQENGAPHADVHAVARSRWAKAGSKVMTLNSIAGGFQTLRDLKDVNEISPAQLKPIKKLGEGAYANVNLCALLTGMGTMNKSFSAAKSHTVRVTPAEEDNAMRTSHRISRKSAEGDDLTVQTTPHTQKAPYVAVKSLKPDVNMPAADLSSFIQEAALTRKLNHKGIVDYIGVGYNNSTSEETKEKSMFIVQEFCEGGNLKDLVMKQMFSPNKPIYTNTQALRWLMQLADALAYLHSAIPKVIHRDLKLDNVLLTSDGPNSGPHSSAKLADFGLVAFTRNKAASKSRDPSVHGRRKSTLEEVERLKNAAQATMAHMGTDTAKPSVLDNFKRMSKIPGLTAKEPAKSSPSSSKLLRPGQLADTGAQLSGQTGTWMYMSPEMYQNLPYSEKTDVFSFAMIIYEVMHRYLVVTSVSNMGTEEEIEDYAHQVSLGYRPPIGEKWPQELRDLIQQCWADQPADRPTMKQVAKELHAMLDAGLVKDEKTEGGGCCSVQ